MRSLEQAAIMVRRLAALSQDLALTTTPHPPRLLPRFVSTVGASLHRQHPIGATPRSLRRYRSCGPDQTVSPSPLLPSHFCGQGHFAKPQLTLRRRTAANGSSTSTGTRTPPSSATRLFSRTSPSRKASVPPGQSLNCSRCAPAAGLLTFAVKTSGLILLRLRTEDATTVWTASCTGR